MTVPIRPAAASRIPATPAPPQVQTAKQVVQFQAIDKKKTGHRILLYGPGGIGKTTLACLMPGKTVVVDADESLGKLKFQLEDKDVPLPLVVPAADWTSLRSVLQSSGYDGIQNIVLDAWSPIELWCVRQTLANTTKDNGKRANNVEDYGFGKGWRHTYDTFLPLLSDLDSHIRAGRNVIIIAHDDTSKVPNPAGQDFIRWEPKMQHTPNASMRYRVKEWCDHVLFLSYDIAVDSEGSMKGKGRGAGFRTLHTAEQPYFMAKSRTTSESFAISHGESPWAEILK